MSFQMEEGGTQLKVVLLQILFVKCRVIIAEMKTDSKLAVEFDFVQHGYELPAASLFRLILVAARPYCKFAKFIGI